MSRPFGVFLLVAAGLLIAVLAYHSISRQQGSSVQTNVAVTSPEKSNPPADGRPLAGERVAAARALRLRPDQVLATVNGHEIKLGDIMPVNTNGSPQDLEVSAQDLNFLLKRAVDRELIFQTAKARGLTLNDSENRQLANLNSMRNQPEPGGIARLNVNEAQRALEMQDSMAFMLQTELMAAQGVSPNVTEDQVAAYYQANQSQFGDLPSDEAARAQAWAKIDFAIRQQLAAATRASYNDKLAAYMNQMESSASIVMASLDQPSNAN